MEVSQITALLNKRKPSASKLGHAYVRNTETGKLDKVALSEVSHTGYFDSKQGTKRRSRKGQITTMPNGYARYCPNFDQEVISYVK